MFQRSFKDVSRFFRGYFKKGSTVFQVSSKIDECFEGDFWVFQGYLKEVKEVSGVFRECFKKVQRIFKVIQQRKFTGWLKVD